MRIPRRKYRQIPPTPPRRAIFSQTSTGIGVRVDGNFCGPNYSDGTFQASIPIGANKTQPVSTRDAACQTHDHEYFIGEDLAGADFRFAKSVVFQGPKGTIMAAGVGAQGVARSVGLLTNSYKKQDFITSTDHFRILKTMPKYARRRTRRGVRKYSKKSRKNVRVKRKVNKRSSKYRRRGTRRNRRVGFSKTNNSVIRYEGGGSLNDANAVYLGHGTPTKNLVRTFFMAMVRQLMGKHGVHFTDWSEYVFALTNLGDGFVIALYYNYGPQQHLSWRSVELPINSAMTYYEVANDLLSQFVIAFKADVDGSDTVYQPVFHRITLFKGSDPETDQVYQLSTIELQNMKVNYYYRSSLRLQNQTANGSNTGGTDVNNTNPLEAKVYYAPKGKNWFPLKYRAIQTQATDYKGWVPHHEYGYIRDQSSFHTETMFQNLPSAKDVGATGAKPFALHPGQIVVDQISHRKTVKVSTFLKNMIEEFSGVEWNSSNLGTCRVLGFEKLLADRSGTVADVKVAWEVNYTVSCSLSHYNVTANAKTVVNPTAI